ncbi:MAG TPA: hypothetical protein VFK94_06615 [Patescibacteria group bacterium]|nr:hypothetical protein [Patescibacteria group bacterium]
MAKVAFDVDDTLILFNNERDEPNRPLLNVLIWFYMQGHDIIVWSGGGKDYAEMWARRLMIDHMVEAREKPPFVLTPRDDGTKYAEVPFNPDDRYAVDICFDDQIVYWGKVNIQVRTMGGVSTHEQHRGL